MPQPLPVNPYNINTHIREHNAYATCLAYEASSIAGLHPVPSGVSSLVCARLLGYMILHAPTDVGRGNISNEVMSCPNEKYLADMAKLYIQIFLRCCEDLSPLRLHTFLICSLLFCPQSSLQKVLLLYPPAILLGPRSMMLQILSYISSLRLLKTTETRKHSLV